MNYKEFIYFAKERDLSRRQIRYLNMLSNYNIKIIYRFGPQNEKADALIRIAKSKLNTPKNKRVR